MRAIVAICSALVMASALAGSAAAQQKTVKACQQEWRANKAANQAKGITEKAFVEQCRAGATPATAPAAANPPPANNAAQTSPPMSTPRNAGRSRATTATTPAAPSASREGTTRGAGEFATEAQAKAHCPGGTVVWANLNSKVYHFAGTRNYGTTKSGAYMCERDADSAGMRAAKNEKKPG